MPLFDVYQLLPITPVRAEGRFLWDAQGNRYLDLYGGHAVIAIGHSHPHYIQRIEQQLRRIAFYSNSVMNPLQEELADKLGKLSGYADYRLFLCNSGAEANENALKIASFITGRKRVIAFHKSFHGRTSGAVAVTDNPAIQSPFNQQHEVSFVPLNNREAVEQAMGGDVAAVIVEGIQGVGGIQLPDDAFLQHLSALCEHHGALLILDEVQSGYGRTGQFFAHQYAGIRPHLITMAKGMGNGFPIGGVLIHPDIPARKGMLGTTFGGGYLACAAALAVLEVIEQENLMAHAARMGKWLMEELGQFPEIQHIRGRGLMIGLDPHPDFAELRAHLLHGHRIFTGEARPHTIRLLPPLNLQEAEARFFLQALRQALEEMRGQTSSTVSFQEKQQM
ncbi:MAG: aspartate aminotransferase family protein [Thermoflavifilum sp.]|uniref:aspartate aminotransferase family protein n=1 Tax=Thermoflavifilum sp. TaxID=1968839 RepID=UPI0018A4EC50|nr:aminotransferase class III-fold pyridoxal phosphate-dependent enzyme [Thermoflavifilum sp.]QOR75917.1 MAG: aspartate aminotransferase family protein [Thermoflavifilum sp.]